MGTASTWREVVLVAWRIVRRTAAPDLPLVLALLAGTFCGFLMCPTGHTLVKVVSKYARLKYPDPQVIAPWLPIEAWVPSMLIVGAIVSILAYLLLRGQQETGIRRGRIMGARVTFTTQHGMTTAQRETCEVIAAPRMIINRRHPAPTHIYICAPIADRRVKLEWEPDTQVYRGTCDEIDFHDDIVAAMSTSQEGNRAVVNFPGRHFVDVDIMNTDGEIDCSAIAVCTGFRLHQDPVRDGIQSVA